MKQLITIILSLHASLFTVHIATAQWGCSCLPEGIFFDEQAQIDSFHINYPGCTEIEGGVSFNGYVYNLNGLSGLKSIGGDLSINTVLFTDMTGLDSLKSIGGNLTFYATELIDMTGLGSLEFIGGDLTIGCFTNTGWYCENYFLENLSGLQELNTIGGELDIQYSSSLTHIDALAGLTHVSRIYIKANPLLNSIAGLVNINPDSLASLTIAGNPALNSCQVESLCSFMDDPAGEINIYDNGTGCNSPVEVATGCGMELSCLPYGNYWFRSQADIDSFSRYFPDCTAINGNIYVIGEDIVNLEPLNQVNSISGDLLLGHEWFGGGNPVLANLDGLENIDSIAGSLRIQYNPMIQNLSGLQNLSYVGSGLQLISNYGLTSMTGLESLSSTGTGIDISANDRIKDLSGLENLTNAGSYILIRLNDSLLSLSGLDNIEPGSITDLNIYSNDALSECAIQSICEYLVNPNGIVEIGGNALGCNSPEEVEEACTVGIEIPIIQNSKFNIQNYPNPTSGIVDFRFSMVDFRWVSLKIYDVHGREVAVVIDKQLPAGEHTVRWNAGAFPAGVYYYRLMTDDRRLTTGTGKIVKY